MVALLRYGSGVPFYRLEGLEASLGIPLPSSTQWEIVAETAMGIHPAFDELIRQAAQGEVFYNDDTSMKILALAAGPLGQVSHGHAGRPGGLEYLGSVRIVDGGMDRQRQPARAMAGLLAVFAEFEENLRERVRAGLEHADGRLAAGLANSGPSCRSDPESLPRRHKQSRDRPRSADRSNIRTPYSEDTIGR